ncbi:MAG: hypothetical protein M9939_03080 [Mesorhizobium sp.]|nr:hypothetical protein [Mesorhizobium sp.]MCO5160092.1 hypothetical protein [Mesorhizobium sp.]
MRLYWVAMFAGVIASTGASASSFVTLPAREEAVSASFVYLGGAEPKVAEAPGAAQPPLAALHYPAPLSTALEDVEPNGAKLEPQIALHYPPPVPAELTASTTQTRVSASIIAMGEPDVEYFKVAAVEPKQPQKRAPDFSPMVIRGGIFGPAFAGSPAPAWQDGPHQAAAPSGSPAPLKPSDTPAEQPKAAPPPAPPKGMSPLEGVH